jgi:hypothetical protein
MVKTAAHAIHFKRNLTFGEGVVQHALVALLKNEGWLLTR